jgi:hypothetical protein
MLAAIEQCPVAPPSSTLDGPEEVYSTQMAQDGRIEGLDRRAKEIENSLSRTARQPEEGWFKRNAHWFPIANPVILVVLFVVGLMAGLFNSVFDARISKKLNEPNGLTAQIQKLSTEVATANGELRAIRRLWEEQLKKTAQLTPQELQKVLPQAAGELRAAAALRVNLPGNLTDSLQKNLSEVSQQAPGYWPAVSQFITYRSSAYSVVFPKCLVRPFPSGFVQSEKADGSRSAPSRVLRVSESRCFLDLDEKNLVTGYDCNHCLVKYSGGPLTLKDVELKDCMFLLALQSEPPAAGRIMIQALLSRDARDLRL